MDVGQGLRQAEQQGERASSTRFARSGFRLFAAATSRPLTAQDGMVTTFSMQIKRTGARAVLNCTKRPLLVELATNHAHRSEQAAAQQH